LDEKCGTNILKKRKEKKDMRIFKGSAMEKKLTI
jgi:hypothetical protein